MLTLAGKFLNCTAETQKLLLLFIYFFFFCFSTDMLPDIMTRCCCSNHREKDKQESLQTWPIYVLFFDYSSLASCLPGNTAAAQTAACGHPLTSIPNGSLPLWQMLYRFDSLLQLFHVGTFGLGGGESVFGLFHTDALLVSLHPNFSLMTW